MRICIVTQVAQDFRTVYEKFDLELFKKLKPPFVRIYVKRFDGCKKGDVIHLELGFLGARQEWLGTITEYEQNDNEIKFTDTGVKPPGFLKDWRHVHRITGNNDSSFIADDITYKTGNVLLDYIMYPVLYYMFYIRKKIYKSSFLR